MSASGSLVRLGFFAPLRRAVVRVDVIGVVLADGEHEPDVALGDARGTDRRLLLSHDGVDGHAAEHAATNMSLAFIGHFLVASPNRRDEVVAGSALRNRTCGANPQSARAAESSTSAGHESTMPCRLMSVFHVICASGNARSTSCVNLFRRRVERREVVGRARQSIARRGRQRRAARATPSGMAMNGMRVSGRTKHAYGSPLAAA